MIAFEGKKLTIPLTNKKIIEVWVNGYMIYPETSSVPDEIRKTYKSCFATGEWWNIYDWTNDLYWANDVEEAIINYDERDGI